MNTDTSSAIRAFPGAESFTTSVLLVIAAVLTLAFSFGAGGLTFTLILLAMAASTAMRAQDKADQQAELDRWLDHKL